MTESDTTNAVRFGQTLIQAVVGELVDQPVQALIYAGNPRGMMGAGATASIRSAAGPEVEREAMTRAPFDLGTAVLTSSGRLGVRGIDAIVHAIVQPTLGEPAEEPVVVRAVEAALRLLDERRIRSVATPLLGISAEALVAERASMAESQIDAIVAHLRRPGSRLERVIVVSRFADDLPTLFDTITRARQRSWTSPA